MGEGVSGLRCEFLRSLAAWKTQGWFLSSAPRNAWSLRGEGVPSQAWVQTRRCSYREGLCQLRCPLRGVPRERASRRTGRWKAAVGIGAPEAAGPPLGMRRGSKPVGLCKKGALAELRRLPHGQGAGRGCTDPAANSCPAVRRPLLRSHDRPHGARLCCHHSPGMAQRRAALPAGGEQWISSWARKPAHF